MARKNQLLLVHNKVSSSKVMIKRQKHFINENVETLKSKYIRFGSWTLSAKDRGATESSEVIWN